MKPVGVLLVVVLLTPSLSACGPGLAPPGAPTARPTDAAADVRAPTPTDALTNTTPSPSHAPSATSTPTDTQKPEPAGAATATPTPPGTWEMVIWGVVYDTSSGLDKPVTGVRVSYDHFSYQGGGTDWTVTDEYGGYEFTLLVHDTDTLDLSVQAEGFAPYSRRFTGMELYTGGGGSRIDLGLTPLPAATAAP
jgi:hypothetical protein